jgi:protein involved in polysaccharide export with SLBB domain
MIRVIVFGMNGTVRRPGYYYLPHGAVVRDAIEAAQGLDDFAWWRDYSGIERQKSDGSFQVIHFTRNRKAEEQILLLNGDRIYFGHETY